MGLALNSIDDDTVRDNLPYELEQLAQMEASPRPADGAAARRYDEGIAAYCLDIGLMLYQQQEEKAKIRRYLCRAGELRLAATLARPSPQPDEHRSPWEFETTQALVVIFSDLDVRKQIAQVGRAQYQHPDNLASILVGDYVNLIQEYIGSSTVKFSDWKTLEDRCKSIPKSADSKQTAVEIERWILPSVRALKAIVQRDTLRLQDAVNAYLEGHRVAAKKDGLKKSVEGFIALPALMMAKLAKEIGFPVSIENVYLPLPLLEN